MNYRILGRTGMTVSRLCFGALTVGPLQAKLPLREGAAIIRAALDAGVNFIDTAELYQTYDYIREALGPYREKTIIATKSYAYSYEGMKESVEKACRALGREYIDIFMLHEQTSRLTLKGHAEALQYLVDAKQAGIVRAIGVSTHTVEVVRAAAMYDEIEVIHPILNMEGIGIIDGSVKDMMAAIAFAAQQGKGIYTMKALGGGHLSKRGGEALRWILEQANITAVAVGMQSVDEVALNTTIFSGNPVPERLAKKVVAQERRLLVEEWCLGCGVCVEKCPMKALVIQEGRAVPERHKCVLCGYCGAHCPEFALKIV